MALTINIATRSRPALLKETIERTLPNLTRGDTILMVSVDQDDKETRLNLKGFPKDERLLISIKPREDSRGEKYDRALTEAPASVYLAAVDYAPIVTPGFDQKIIDAAEIWPDGIGVVYTNMCDELVPFLQAPTAKFVEKLGYINSHEFPYWFSDHEIADIAWMVGRVNFADVNVDVSARPGKTLRLQELEFWTAYYDMMALDRRSKARAIINDPEFQLPDFLKQQFSNWYPLVESRSEARNRRVRASAAQCEEHRGEAKPDQGYLRSKAKAERKLNELFAALKAAA